MDYERLSWSVPHTFIPILERAIANEMKSSEFFFFVFFFQSRGLAKPPELCQFLTLVPVVCVSVTSDVIIEPMV